MGVLTVPSWTTSTCLDVRDRTGYRLTGENRLLPGFGIRLRTNPDSAPRKRVEGWVPVPSSDAMWQMNALGTSSSCVNTPCTQDGATT